MLGIFTRTPAPQNLAKPSNQLDQSCQKLLNCIEDEISSEPYYSTDCQCIRDSCQDYRSIINNAIPEKQAIMLDALMEIAIKHETGQRHLASEIYRQIMLYSPTIRHLQEATIRLDYLGNSNAYQSKPYPAELEESARIPNRPYALYKYALTLKNDIMASAHLFKLAADMGCTEAQRELNSILYSRENYFERYRLFSEGVVMVPNLKAAIDCLKEARTLTDVRSLLVLGADYERKYNARLLKLEDKDMLIALAYFNKAKELGSIEGEIGVLRISIHFTHLGQLSPAQVSEACYQLGMLYLNGKPGELDKNLNAAETYLKKAAEAKHILAATVLHKQYTNPASGLNADTITLLKYANMCTSAILSNVKAEIDANKEKDQPSSVESALVAINLLKVDLLVPEKHRSCAERITHLFSGANTAFAENRIDLATAIFNGLFDLLQTEGGTLRQKTGNSEEYVINDTLIFNLAEAFEKINDQKKSFFSNSTDVDLKQKIEACYEILGIKRENKAGYERYLKIKADAGDAQSQYYFGIACKNNHITDERLARFNGTENALNYLTKAANNDLGAAAIELAEHYLNSPWKINNFNEKNARLFLKKAISSTYSKDEMVKLKWQKTIFDWAKKYETNPPLQKAWLCYEIASELGLRSAKQKMSMLKANKGDVEEAFRFGSLCYDGKISLDVITTKNSKWEGYRYLLQAADKGHGAAALIVAQANANGENWLKEPSDELAEKYFKIAINGKVKGANEACEAFKLNQLANQNVGVGVGAKPKPFSGHSDL